jgi:hypothetical protein
MDRTKELKMPNMIVMKELKTQDDINKFIQNKIVKEVKYKEGYSDIDIYFTDGTYISVVGEDCYNFMVEVEDYRVINPESNSQ